MADLQLQLTNEECELLRDFLSQRLKEKRVEEHRTDASSYRQFVVHQERLIEGLLSKLGPVVVA